MMKKLFCLFFVCVLCACEKDQFSMAPEELAGTYWQEESYHIWNYENGAYVYWGDLFNGDVSGGRGRAVLYFEDRSTLVEYVKVSSSFGSLGIAGYYNGCSFDYNSETRQVITDIKALEVGNPIPVKEFTAARIVLVFETERVLGSRQKEEHTFVRYTPDDMWRRQVKDYLDYNEIAWPE